MDVQSIFPFLLIIAPFAAAFFLEAVVIYFFRIKRFWASAGISILVNLVSFAVLYGASLLLGKLGYELNGLRLPLQAFLALWWISVVADGFLLQLFSTGAEKKTTWLCSIVMNSLSYLLFYFFIANGD